MARDYFAERRLRRYVERSLLELQAEAVKHQLEIQRDPEGKYAGERYADRSTKTGMGAKWVEVAAAELRARHEAATPRVLGVVMMQPRIEDAQKWEAFAEAGGQPAIEAVAEDVPKPGGESS